MNASIGQQPALELYTCTLKGIGRRGWDRTGTT